MMEGNPTHLTTFSLFNYFVCSMRWQVFDALPWKATEEPDFHAGHATFAVYITATILF